MTKPVRVMAWGGRTKGGGCCCGVDNADASTVSFPPMGVAPNDAVPLSRGGVSAPFSSKSPINRLRSAFAYDTVFVEFARTKGRRFGISSTSAACKHKKERQLQRMDPTSMERRAYDHWQHFLGGLRKGVCSRAFQRIQQRVQQQPILRRCGCQDTRFSRINEGNQQGKSRQDAAHA
jgi:hypothetical protein